MGLRVGLFTGLDHYGVHGGFGNMELSPTKNACAASLKARLNKLLVAWWGLTS